MSWYSFGELAARRAATEPQRCRGPAGFVSPQRQVSLAFTILNMNTQDDVERLTTSLWGVAGVTGVAPDLPNRKLNVSFNSPGTSVEQLAYAIARAGYSYLQRA